MAHFATNSFHLDTEAAGDGDRAVLNVFQVLAINVVCSVTLVSVAIMFDLGWWMVALVGWLGGSVATLVVAVAIVVLWPVESQTVALRAVHTVVAVTETQAEMDLWRRDRAAEFAALPWPAPEIRGTAPQWDAEAERLADAMFEAAARAADDRNAA